MALAALLAAARNGDATLTMADAFTISLTNGTILYWTNWDSDFLWGSPPQQYQSGGALIQGLKYKCATGLEVDKQQLTIMATPSDLINGTPVLEAIAQGAFDGAQITRDRVFFDPSLSGGIDGLTLFAGRVSTVDTSGRTQAAITVASLLVILDYNMPRNLWSPTCVHTLYDAGCGVDRTAFATNTVCGAGSNRVNLLTAVAQFPEHVQGSVLFTSGLNSNLTATVKSVVAGTSLLLMYPMPNDVSTGEAFTVYFGCDHTRATCNSRFNNLLNHRAFPYVPPPQIAF